MLFYTSASSFYPFTFSCYSAERISKCGPEEFTIPSWRDGNLLFMEKERKNESNWGFYLILQNSASGIWNKGVERKFFTHYTNGSRTRYTYSSTIYSCVLYCAIVSPNWQKWCRFTALLDRFLHGTLCFPPHARVLEAKKVPILCSVSI